MEHSPNTPNTAEQKIYTKELLTFEEFQSRKSNGLTISNNFYALFLKESLVSDLIRTQDFFVRFQHENKEFEESLTGRISKWRENQNATIATMPEDILEDLYKAYTIMFTYDEIKTNDDLFR